MSRRLMVPAADTQLYADTPGGTPPLLFLSGGFGTVKHWDNVLRRLAQKYRAGAVRRAGAREVGTSARRSGSSSAGWGGSCASWAALGRSARMSPAESADIVIDMDAVNGELGPDFAALVCPTVFVVGTGAHSGATEEEMRTVRAAAADAQASNERVSVFATTPRKHTQILSKAAETVVAALEDVIHRSR